MLTPTLKVGIETYVAVSELNAQLKRMIDEAKAEAAYANRALKRTTMNDATRPLLAASVASERAALGAYKQVQALIARYENRNSIDVRA